MGDRLTDRVGIGLAVPRHFGQGPGSSEIFKDEPEYDTAFACEAEDAGAWSVYREAIPFYNTWGRIRDAIYARKVRCHAFSAVSG
jgi:hypothetical protein